MKTKEQETMNQYNVRLHYKTICNTVYVEYATSEEEALQKAKRRFERYNAEWLQDGGEKKELQYMEIDHGW